MTNTQNTPNIDLALKDVGITKETTEFNFDSSYKNSMIDTSISFHNNSDNNREPNPTLLHQEMMIKIQQDVWNDKVVTVMGI